MVPRRGNCCPDVQRCLTTDFVANTASNLAAGKEASRNTERLINSIGFMIYSLNKLK